MLSAAVQISVSAATRGPVFVHPWDNILKGHASSNFKINLWDISILNMRIKGAFDTNVGPLIIIQKWSFGFDRIGLGGGGHSSPGEVWVESIQILSKYKSLSLFTGSHLLDARFITSL